MNTYRCYYEGQHCTLQAETLYAAKLAAVAKFKPPRRREHMVSVLLVETPAGPVPLHRSNWDF